MPDPAAVPRSLLAHYLALLYGLAIAYASLQPFAPWIAPVQGTPFFLFAPWPPRWTRFDVTANVIAYFPFGCFVALIPRRRGAHVRIIAAVAAGALLSLAMETLQMLLPPRDASAVDLIANTAGAAAGGAIAGWIARSERTAQRVAAIRNQWFLSGTVGDVGVALLLIWLAAQVNPGIPLFATTFDPDFPRDQSAAAPGAAQGTDAVAILLAATNSAFQMLGVGLFLAVLLRQRRYVGGAVLVLIGAAVLVKGVAAALLLKPAIFEHWLSPGVSTGIAGGALLLLAAIGLPRPVQVALAAVALLASVLTPLLTPDVLFARAPLWIFQWSYGHLLNFNGLTLTVLLVWPLAASALLFALAGRPDWGSPSSPG